ncbi:hypothetical protein LUZ60_009164 [Juncus effusus]|nr:hypothetical protein LUZ60_009164 [Juncus effusus]
MACTSCMSLLLQSGTSIGGLQSKFKPQLKLLSSNTRFKPVSKSFTWRKKINIACKATTETESEGNHDDKLDSETNTEPDDQIVTENANVESNSISNKSTNGPNISQSLRNLELYNKMEGNNKSEEKASTPNSTEKNNSGSERAKSLSNLELYNKMGATNKQEEKISAPNSTEKNNNGSEIAKSLNNLELYNKTDGNNKTEGESSVPNSTEKEKAENDSQVDVASGSPLPGILQQIDEIIKIPKSEIDILKDQVFGFDTFYVTSQEPYEGGVLFKGNLRGIPAISYEKIKKRLDDKFGDKYSLFILINPEDENPVAVVVPKISLDRGSTVVPEWFASGAFGLVTIFTLLLRNVPALQTNLLSTFDNLDLLKEGVPGALVTALIIGIHEIAHFTVAKEKGIKLGIPFFVPSWQIGSFGAITRILSIVQNRADLLKLSVAGPLAGFSLGIILLFLGFIFPPFDGVGLVVDSSIFHESFLAGGIAKIMLGDALKEGSKLAINPLVLWAWAGLLINAINSIPSGELDGGRIAFSLWGRKISTRLSNVTLGLLGISAIFSDVAFYWVALIFFLQRGPVAPLSEEITDPDANSTALGVAVLLLALLVCLPYPFAFTGTGFDLLDL